MALSRNDCWRARSWIVSAADRERWRQIDELLQFALQQKEGDSDAFAHQAWNGDKAPERKIFRCYFLTWSN